MINYLRNELDFFHELDYKRLSKYNSKYETFKKNPFESFVLSQYPVHSRIFDIFQDLPTGKVLEIGSFIPVIPLGLKKMGFEVSAIEKTSFYGGAYAPIIKCLNRCDIQFFDLDIIDKSQIKGLEKYDYISLIAVVEHLLGSPKQLFESIHSLLKDDGKFIFEVPSLSSLRKRIIFALKGKNPMSDYANYFNSAYPFEGHHREMTYNEVIYLFRNTCFEIEELIPVNQKQKGFKNSVLHFFQNLLGKRFADSFIVIARKI